jgi:hypothetical protein
MFSPHSTVLSYRLTKDAKVEVRGGQSANTNGNQTKSILKHATNGYGEEVTHNPSRMKVNSTLNNLHIFTPIEFSQMRLLHAWVSVLLLHHVNNAKPTVQSRSKTLFEIIFIRGLRPMRQCETIRH